MTSVTQGDLIPAKISSDILDTLGRSFKFKHAKGIAEWLKNSLDQYLRLRTNGQEPRSGSWPVILNLMDGQSAKNGPNLAVIDFGGTDISKVESFFLHWGDRSAATHGRTISAEVTGGHGNGGKFYMREMWKGSARFLTWRDGKATSLRVEKRTDGKVGRWELQDAAIGWRNALGFALSEEDGLGGNRDVLAFMSDWDPDLVDELNAGKRGFSAVIGMRGEQLLSTNDVVRGGKWERQKLIDDIKDAPQARRPIRELSIAVLANGKPILERLVPETVDEDESWPAVNIELPGKIVHASSADVGFLRIITSRVPLSGRKRDLNAVHITDGSGNPIAFYPINQLPLPGASPILILLHGELKLDFSGSEDLIQNDRERLVSSPATEAILDWVSEQVWQQAQRMESAQKAKEKQAGLLRASVLNEAFNTYAKQFLEELQTQIFVDFVEDPSGGGPGAGGTGRGPTGTGPGGDGPRDNGTGGGKGDGGSREEAGSQDPVRRPKYPQVLLSGLDQDPAFPGTTKTFTESHPPLNQDDIDKRSNVWWINTSHPFAAAALSAGGPEGAPFKNHQMSMFRDVVQREALRFLQRREAELGLDRVENELDEISNRFLAELPYDLVESILAQQPKQ